MTLSPQQNDTARFITELPATEFPLPLPEREMTESPPASDEEGGEAFDPEKGPLRRCIVTRERHPVESMIRFVIGPDRVIVPDVQARLPGRGMWLSARKDVVEAALARKAFARAARAEVAVPVDMPAIIEAALTRRVIEILGLTRRAGQAVTGFAKAREWLVAGQVALLVHASDGSVDERNRLLNGRAVPVIAPLSAQDLGRIFGRDHAVHVAVSAGRLATMLLNETKRLDGIRRTRTETDQPGG